MRLREDLLKKIEKKLQEIRELESQIREANAYIHGLQDVLKLIPRDVIDEKKTEHVLRPNSDMAKARDFLRTKGKAMHVGEILDGIGKGDTKPNRLSLSGSLGDYVRKGEIFTRPEPNTFGLTEFQSAKPIESMSEPPEDFGINVLDENIESVLNDSDPFADE